MGEGTTTVAVAKGENLYAPQVHSGLFLLFAKGTRPSASDVERALAVNARAVAAISHRPPDEEGWVELVASGLTFDLSHLVPTEAGEGFRVGQYFGLNGESSLEGLESVVLRPGAHISAGAALLPVLRVMLHLAATLIDRLPVVALCWQPAATAMAPGYFRTVVEGWIAGGPFPALGLTGLSRCSDGTFVTTGLAFLAGQELRIRTRPGEAPADTAKLAVRLIDSVVSNGALAGGETFDGPGGERLVAVSGDKDGYVTIERAGS